MLFILVVFAHSFAIGQEQIPLLRTDSAEIHEALKQADKYQQLGNKKEESRHYDQIAFIYWEHNFFQDAINFYQKSLKLNNALDNLSGSSMINSNLGMLYSDIQEYDKSLSTFQKTLDYRRMIGDKLGIINASINMSVVYNNLKRYDQSIERLNEALTLAREMNNPDLIKSCYGMLTETYEKAGNTEKTTHYFNLYRTFHEKVQRDKEIQNLQEIKETRLQLKLTEAEKRNKELEIQLKNRALKKTKSQLDQATDSAQQLYENLSRAELSMKLLNKENELKDINLKNQLAQKKKLRNQLLMVLLILLLFIAILGIAIRAYFYKQKANRQLETQKAEIMQQAEKLRTVNEKLVELDKFKEGMNGMMVHDLKNPLNTILGETEKANTKQAARQMLNMVQNILDVQKFENTNLQLQISNYKVIKVLDTALLQVENLYKRKSLNIEKQIPKGLYLRADYDILLRIFVNLLTNAIKYTPNNGTIKLIALPHETLVKFIISDTGQGVPPEYHQKIFDKFSQLDARDSGAVRSTGLGLSFCKLAVEAHGGNIGVESDGQNGSTFYFWLKKGNSVEYEADIDENNQTKQVEFIQLADEYKIPIQIYLQKLRQLSVYEFSKIMAITKSMPLPDNPNTKNWKNKLDNAVRACNEEKYQQLIK